MNQSENGFPEERAVGDLSRTTLPRRVVAIVILLTFLPVTLNLMGVSFSGVNTDTGSEDSTAVHSVKEILEQAEIVNKGKSTYVLLEWTAFLVALATAIFALAHYSVAHDVTTPTISIALFFSGMIDGFQAMATIGLLPFFVVAATFIPFVWFVSRLVNACFLIAGTLPFVLHQHEPGARSRRTTPQFLALVVVLLAVMAYIIVFLCAWMNPPQAMYADAKVVHRPFDMIPLFLYLFAGSVVFPRFYRAQPSLFSHALFVSVIPNVAAQLHAVFGAAYLYDNNFNIASYEKILAYAVPFVGLLLDYRRAYYADVALQVTEEKLQVARNVQQGLLPQAPPAVLGYDIAGSYHPADMVGGDYYDYVPMGDGRLGIVVADVSGHEIGASLLMAKTRAYLRALAKSDGDLQTTLGRLHEFLIEDTQDKWFVTMFFAALDARTGTLEYAGAAQQAHVVHPDGSLTLLKSTSTPLAVFADHPPRCAAMVPLNSGDVFVAVTDGIVEAKSPAGEQFGYPRMLEVVKENRHRAAADIIDALNRAVRAHCGTLVFADDMTLVAVRRT